ncbi:MAG: hypothetical protein RBR71_04955 [Gudongella sp.]|nr:hypothetical protein [Gudongella sp.]
MRNRIISMVLIISMILPVTGCGGGGSTKTQSDEVLVEGLVNDENLILASNGIELRLNSVNISDEANAKISKVSNAPVLDDESGIVLDVYDFSIEGVTEFPGVIELLIPMDLPDGDLPGAAYLNETTNEWEPVAFSYDKESGSVIILTDHLSKYGVFSVSSEGTRRARVEFLGLYGDDEDKDFLAAVEEYSIGGVPASQCIEIGSSAAGDALQLGGDFLGNIAQSAGYVAYGDDVLSSLGDRLGSLGLLVSVVQIGTNLYNGKINDAIVGSMKTSYTYIMGKVVSKLSNSVLSASMASVAIVDYAINKFGTTAIQGRADIYRDAYSIYYMKGEDGFKTSADWFHTFYPMFKDPTMTQDALKAEIDRIVSAHCNEFWTGSNKLGVDYFVSQARERMAWTGGGAGLNQDLKDSISTEKRSIMYNDILPGVFYQIAHKINMENENRLRAEYKDLSNYLNTLVSFSVKDPKHAYANHLIRFSPLNDKATVQNWTGKFNKDGELETNFTLYGHMYAGSPNKLDIFLPDANIDKDEPIRSLEFKVTPPIVEIVLGEEISNLKYESGENGTILQLGLHAALREANTIKISKDGDFRVEVGYATASGSANGKNYTSEVTRFYMEGNIDPGSLSGSGIANGAFKFTRKEISPLEGIEGEVKEYITTHSYDDTFEGQVNITGSGDKIFFNFNLLGYRNGYSKLQYHSIDTAGVESWGDNPTVTDESGEISAAGKYTFIVEQ